MAGMMVGKRAWEAVGSSDGAAGTTSAAAEEAVAWYASAEEEAEAQALDYDA